MAYLTKEQRNKKSDSMLIVSELFLDQSFCAVQLLNSLIEKHFEELERNYWDKYFVISENIKPFTVYGKSSQIYGLLDVTKVVSHLMLQYGLSTDEVNDENINVEFHYAMIDYRKGDKHEHPDLAVHRDDYGGTDYPVHTCIIYKTNDLVKGNFAFYDDGYGNELTKPSKIVDINGGENDTLKCIIFDGKLYHMPLPIVRGNRFALSFQIKKAGSSNGV